MSGPRPLVILRPEPGGHESLKRAIAAGFKAESFPLFAMRSKEWQTPDPGQFDAVLFTSANAARHGGEKLKRFTGLPAYAVGEKTARAVRKFGFGTVIAGDGDASAIAERIRADGRVRVFHPTGEAVRPFDETGLEIARTAVYASDPVEPQGLADALLAQPVILLHSPRAAEHFARFCDAHAVDRATVSLIAISRNALDAAGGGWRHGLAAERPDEDAMFALASSLGEGPAIG